MALLATHADNSPRKIYYSIANRGSFKNFVVKKERPEGNRYRKYSTHSVNKYVHPSAFVKNINKLIKFINKI